LCDLNSIYSDIDLKLCNIKENTFQLQNSQVSQLLVHATASYCAVRLWVATMKDVNYYNKGLIQYLLFTTIIYTVLLHTHTEESKSIVDVIVAMYLFILYSGAKFHCWFKYLLIPLL
jgi:hypothetical protein